MAEIGGTTRTAQNPDHAPIRKPLRKGTQSCTECRRRKIKCSFRANDPHNCIPCSARGSRCIDQRTINTPPDEKGTLRERVARLESLLEGLLIHNPHDGTYSISTSLGLESNQDDDDAENAIFIEENVTSAPLMSVLSDAIGNGRGPASESSSHNGILNRSNTATHSNLTPNSPIILCSRGMSDDVAKAPGTYSEMPSKAHCSRLNSMEPSNHPGKKSRLICEKLRSALPKYDEMMAVFAKNGSWWGYWRQKTYGEAKPTESLTQYAARIYTSQAPMDLALLVCAFGLSTETNGSRFLSLVDKLVISDDEYASTMTGLECIVLQGKCYLDIGQPRRGWLAYRRGLVLAQLMNLHRTHRDSLEADNLWWALYQGDRFMSILLGLPYSINDAHIDLEVRESTDRRRLPLQPFAVRCGMAAGKLIDRNQSSAEPSISKSFEIDHELQNIAGSMPKSWWDISILPTESSLDIAEVRLRLLLHVFFLHIRMYLHLPFLFKYQQKNSQPYDKSRAECLESARLMVGRWQMLRSDFRGECLYDCKGNDFVGFTASIVLLIGNAHNRKTLVSPGQPTSQERQDWNLCEKSLAIFKDLNKRSPCKLFSQSHRALSVLMGKHERSANNNSTPSSIFIPYFGKVSAKHESTSSPESWGTQTHQHLGARPSETKPGARNSNGNDRSPESNDPKPFYDSTMPDAGNFWDFEPLSTMHDQFSLQASSSLFGGNDFLPEAEYFGPLPGDADPFTWLNDNMPMMDIDQDWSWMEQ